VVGTTVALGTATTILEIGISFPTLVDRSEKGSCLLLACDLLVAFRWDVSRTCEILWASVLCSCHFSQHKGGNSDVLLVWLYWHEKLWEQQKFSILWAYSIFWTFGMHCLQSQWGVSRGRGRTSCSHPAGSSATNGGQMAGLLAIASNYVYTVVTKFHIDLLQSCIYNIALLAYMTIVLASTLVVSHVT
jgi:hypothetical protein